GGIGGAITASAGGMRITHTLLKGNRSSGRGAAMSVEPNGSVNLSNALGVGNSGGPGTVVGQDFTLAKVTGAGKTAAGLLAATRGVSVSNVILARNRPSDCAVIPALAFRSGHNLQSDGSCPGVPVADAFLDAFYVPGVGSPALAAGDSGLCHGP